MAEIYCNLPFGEYRKIEAVNATLLKAFLRSPEHGDWEAKHARESTPATVLGAALHTLILEGRDTFNARYNPGGPVNPKTGEPFGRSTKAFADWCNAEGVNPDELLTPTEIENIEGMAAAIKAQPTVLDTIRSAGAMREVVIVWDQPWGETTIKCKMRADYIHPVIGVVDVKTCQDCRAEAFARDIAKFGYDLQAAFYASGSRAAGLNPHADFGWIAIEKKPPHMIGLWSPTDNMMDTGAANMRLALDRYMAWEANGREVVRADVQFRPIDLPAWAKGNPIDSLRTEPFGMEDADE